MVPPQLIGGCRIISSCVGVPFTFVQQIRTSDALTYCQSAMERAAQRLNSLVNLGNLIIGLCNLTEGIAYIGFWSLRSVIFWTSRFTALGIATVGLCSLSSNSLTIFCDVRVLIKDKKIDSNFLSRYLHFGRNEGERIAEFFKNNPTEQEKIKLLLKARVVHNIVSCSLSMLAQLINLVSIPFIFIRPEIAIGLCFVYCSLEAVNSVIYFAVNYFLRERIRSYIKL